MDLDGPREGLIFYNFWNLFRKLLFGILVVFCSESMYTQIVAMLVCSVVMLRFILVVWPFVRRDDNMVKVLNEMI